MVKTDMVQRLSPGELLELNAYKEETHFVFREWYNSKLPADYSKLTEREFFDILYGESYLYGYLCGALPYHLVFLREVIAPTSARFQEFLDPNGNRLICSNNTWRYAYTPASQT